MIARNSGEYRNREEGFKFGFLGIPAFRDGDPVTCLMNPETLMIPVKAENPELAKEFLKFIYTDTGIKLNGEKAKAVMAVKGAVELVKGSITDSSYDCFKAVENGMIPVLGAFKPLAKGSKIDISNEIYKPITSIMNKQMTAAQWAYMLDKVYTQIKDELARQEN
jgi:N-acetylglucosamine transport system substrate-binding protein